MNTIWIKAYDLSDDDEQVAKVQNATLNTSDYGLVPEVALYGSAEWWEAISNGLIQKHTIDGVITDVFTSGDSNWPQFEVDNNGVKTDWTRFGDQSLYEVGRRVKLEYVVQKVKKAWIGSPYQNEVLTISVEMSGQRKGTQLIDRIWWNDRRHAVGGDGLLRQRESTARQHGHDC